MSRIYRIVYAIYDQRNYTAGPTIQAMRLLPELVRRGHEVHAFIFTLDYSRRKLKALRASGVQCHLVRYHATTEEDVRWVLRKLADIQPDVFVPAVIHIAAYAAKYIQSSGIPSLVHHVSDDEYNWAMADFFGCNPMWHAAGLMCISDELRDAVKAKGALAEVRKIAPGSTIPEGTADQSKVRRLVYAGRLEVTQKQIVKTFEAICRIMKKHTDLSFDVLGDGSQRLYLENYVKGQGLADRVIFKGMVPPESVQEVMLDAQLLILLSDYEGLPGAVIDAMMCGLVPVCLAMPGGLSELVSHEHTGVIVEDRDADFDQAMERLMTDDGFRVRLSHAARDHAASNYSVERMVDENLEFFNDLIGDATRTKKILLPTRIDLPEAYGHFRNIERRRVSLWQRTTWPFKKILQSMYMTLLEAGDKYGG